MVGRRSVRGRLAAVGALLVTTRLGSAGSASAQVEQVPLTWSAPTGCPTGAAVLAAVKRDLADSGEPWAPFVAVVNVPDPIDKVWQASLRVEARGGRAERRFQAESCEALASAAALIIALAAQGGGGAPPPEPRRGPLVSDAERPSSTEEPVAAQAGKAPGLVVSAMPGDYWGRADLSAGVGGVLDWGTMPNRSAVGIEAAVGPTWTAPGWRLRVVGGAGFFPTQHVVIVDQSSDFWMFTVSGRGCASALVTGFEFGLCVGAELAAMHGAVSEPESLPNPTGEVVRSTQYWLSPLGSVMASWSLLPRVAAFGRADVAVPGTQRSFHGPANSADYYIVPSHSVRAALGLQLSF